MSRYLHLSVYDEERIDKIMSAMASKIRREILRLVNRNSYSITEIANTLGLLVSTTSFHVNILLDAGLVHVQTRSAQHGNYKIISRRLDEINVNFVPENYSSQIITSTVHIPIGSYTDCKAYPSCGIATDKNIIESEDVPSVFYSPARLDAQIIWFNAGYLEYRVPNVIAQSKEIVGLSFSLELCSEAPNYRCDWKSDITFWLNGIEVCTWESPGDFGGNRGLLNPDWWPELSTQYGLLKTVRITDGGTYLDENQMSSVTVQDLHLEQGDYFTLRFGVKEDAVNKGGMNLFGEKFGNYEQNIIMKISYKDK